MPSPDAKYNGAANEISARIQARNRTLMAFFSIAAVLLGVAVRGPESGPQDVKGGSMAIIGGIAIPYLALVMVIISRDVVINKTAALGIATARLTP
jgi:hypothetical protein